MYGLDINPCLSNRNALCHQDNFSVEQNQSTLETNHQRGFSIDLLQLENGRSHHETSAKAAHSIPVTKSFQGKFQKYEKYLVSLFQRE